MSTPPPEPTGSVHEETARLFAALEGAAAAWSRGPAGAAGPGAAGDHDGVGATSHLPGTCGSCPLCVALDRWGRSRPEVLDHLSDAVSAVGAALAALTRPPVPEPGDPPQPGASAAASRSRPRTESIEVTD